MTKVFGLTDQIPQQSKKLISPLEETNFMNFMRLYFGTTNVKGTQGYNVRRRDIKERRSYERAMYHKNQIEYHQSELRKLQMNTNYYF